MFRKKKEDTYLSHLAKRGYLPVANSVIAAAVEKDGLWHHYEEWRISTTTEFKISKEPLTHRVKYRVCVKCDYEFGCLCPTLERAMEMAGLYQQLIMNLFAQVGWPSWVSKASVE